MHFHKIQPFSCYNLSMNVFASIGIVILAMLIMASLQLVPGVFALFHHYSLGKYSFQKTSRLSLFFILGTEIISAFLFIASFFIASILFLNDLDPRNNIVTWIFVGIFASLTIVSFFFYFRHPHSKDTILFLPRRYASALNQRANNVKKPTDAFTLGALSNIYELIFTLPLYIITATEIMYMHTEYFADDLLTILYILISAIPLLNMYLSFLLGHNLADIERSRIKDKTFHRFSISLGYITIMILMVFFRIA